MSHRSWSQEGRGGRGGRGGREGREMSEDWDISPMCVREAGARLYIVNTRHCPTINDVFA